MELHHPIMSKLWDLGGRTKRKEKTMSLFLRTYLSDITVIHTYFSFILFGPIFIFLSHVWSNLKAHKTKGKYFVYYVLRVCFPKSKNQRFASRSGEAIFKDPLVWWFILCIIYWNSHSQNFEFFSRLIVQRCDYMFTVLNSYEGTFENARHMEFTPGFF